MEDALEKKKKELLNLNRLWRNTQELDLKDATLKKVKRKILNKISRCEKKIIQLKNGSIGN
jgi:hypothetical protein